jgi:Fe-S-cluster containining protein
MLNLHLHAAMAPHLHWHCIAGCGACCRLDPALREDALAALNAEQRQAYLALVGPDGWCIHYDTGGRRCRVYNERPDFCRVSNLVTLFAPELRSEGDLAPTPVALETDDNDAGEPPAGWSEAEHALAIACCTQQIRSEYGGRGRVMRRFQRAIRRP